jgi:hypothetical protein
VLFQLNGEGGLLIGADSPSTVAYIFSWRNSNFFGAESITLKLRNPAAIRTLLRLKYRDQGLSGFGDS